MLEFNNKQNKQKTYINTYTKTDKKKKNKKTMRAKSEQNDGINLA